MSGSDRTKAPRTELVLKLHGSISKKPMKVSARTKATPTELVLRLKGTSSHAMHFWMRVSEKLEKIQQHVQVSEEPLQDTNMETPAVSSQSQVDVEIVQNALGNLRVT